MVSFLKGSAATAIFSFTAASYVRSTGEMIMEGAE
jgi:hypothetical protein